MSEFYLLRNCCCHHHYPPAVIVVIVVSNAILLWLLPTVNAIYFIDMHIYTDTYIYTYINAYIRTYVHKSSKHRQNALPFKQLSKSFINYFCSSNILPIVCWWCQFLFLLLFSSFPFFYIFVSLHTGFDVAKHWLAVSSILLIIGAASVAVPLALRVAASEYNMHYNYILYPIPYTHTNAIQMMSTPQSS